MILGPLPRQNDNAIKHHRFIIYPNDYEQIAIFIIDDIFIYLYKVYQFFFFLYFFIEL